MWLATFKFKTERSPSNQNTDRNYEQGYNCHSASGGGYGDTNMYGDCNRRRDNHHKNNGYDNRHNNNRRNDNQRNGNYRGHRANYDHSCSPFTQKYPADDEFCAGRGVRNLVTPKRGAHPHLLEKRRGVEGVRRRAKFARFSK